MSQPSHSAGAEGSRARWWFAAAAALYLLAWAAWLTLAARHPVAEVPLAAAPGR